MSPSTAGAPRIVIPITALGHWSRAAQHYHQSVDEIRRELRRHAAELGRIPDVPPTVHHGLASVERRLSEAAESLRREAQVLVDTVTEAVLADRPVFGDAGGWFSTRSVGTFTPTGVTPTQRGVDTITTALAATADPSLIHHDEFAIVDHGQGAYTIVLPGVVDLTAPTRGLHPVHRSVRDLDTVAVGSAGGTDIADNLYAEYVSHYVTEVLPPGARLTLIGHSFGADTALDLAADPGFNGGRFIVSQVVATGYYNQPQLAEVAEAADHTEVLVLQNTRDLVVVAEAVAAGAWPSGLQHPEVTRFDGGHSGAGHDTSVYIDHLKTHLTGPSDPFTTSAIITAARRLDAEGFTTPGTLTTVDVSVPAPDRPNRTAGGR